MNIASSSTAYGGGQAQRLLAALLEQTRGSTGQKETGSTQDASAGAPDGPPPGPPPGGGAQQFVANTLSGLLSTQENQNGPPSSDDLAQKLIQAADSDGDGSLSVDEIASALGSSDTTGLTNAVAKLDTDGDGKLSASELSSALDARKSAHHAHHHGRASSSDIAAKLISDADSDSDGSLSLDEIKSALGDGADSDTLTSAFGKLDTDGNGLLSASELASALDAFRQAHDGVTSGAQTATTASVTA